MRSYFDKREIVLGVTGSIAAYKACDLASRLVEAGAKVTPVLTESAQRFVGTTSFEAITGRPAITGLFTGQHNSEIEHISVARRAHCYCIAPATANMLAKAAHGIADDWLSTTLLATRAPILFAPAMNTQMYLHDATQANISTLRGRGCAFVGPGKGALACGEWGPGRMIEVAAILEALAVLLEPRKDLAGKRILMTSGANHEPIDPVRFIGNRSSGRMGRELALAFLARGAKVTVVTGPHEAPLPHQAEVIAADTAQQMFETVQARLEESDVFVGAAAVADYRVASASNKKHKRDGKPRVLELEQNPDIAAYIGAHKRAGQIAVGFAAETEDAEANGRAKLERKRLDLLLANTVGGDASAIGSEAAEAWLLHRDGNSHYFGHAPKEQLAQAIADAVAGLLNTKDTPAATLV